MAKSAPRSATKEKSDTVRVNANIAQELHLRFRHALLDDGLDFSKWLRQQIEKYLAERARSGDPRRGR